ncbi:hypothetical protein CKAH01_02051 [Colletotrichum kahawae]|uniref:Uncharacterized protein n=1 Tax=Colletotrichum kahawae TaxID=34407 RepID=A0AAE0CZL7_COLKA|nr:hypothetical protein CKAH01_02051 [Colletotrichum kahawae]
MPAVGALALIQTSLVPGGNAGPDVNGEMVPLDLRLAAGWSVRLGGECAVSCRREQFGRLSGVVRLVLKWSGNWQAWPGLVRAWAVPRDVGFSHQEKWPLGRFSAGDSSPPSANSTPHSATPGPSLVTTSLRSGPVLVDGPVDHAHGLALYIPADRQRRELGRYFPQPPFDTQSLALALVPPGLRHLGPPGQTSTSFTLPYSLQAQGRIRCTIPACRYQRRPASL